MISYITLSMPHVLTLYYLLTLSLSVLLYTLPQRHYPLDFLEHVLHCTYSLLQVCLFFIIFNRDGVEDTRLEAKAKAKDTKKSEAKAKDSLSEDRHSRGQGQECWRPRPRTKDTSTGVLQTKKIFQKFSGDLKKKKVSTKIFQAISIEKRFPKNFSSSPQNFKDSKITAVLLEPRTGQFSRT